MTTPFPRDEHLTAIAIAYKNPSISLIADAVFPRTEVGKEEFTYTEYSEGQAYTVPNTRVGERSQVPRVELSGTEVQSKTEDFGLDGILTASDMSQTKKTVDPRDAMTEHLTNLVLLDREARCAALAFDAAQYGSGNKVDLSGDLGGGAGADQWDESSADPLVLVRERLEDCLMRPNVMAFGHRAWLKFSSHPKVVSAALGNDGTNGFATRERVAELLELDEVVVGRGWVNSVKPGKNPVLLRVWGPHALAFYRDLTVTTTGGITFGVTAQFGTRVAGSKPIDVGLRGGTAVRSGESVKEVVVAPRAAYFFQNAVPAS